ncbi:histidine kinase [Paenibacillus sp. HWE-109]|uniref:cache domain-containing sensor histidine kinase n=1 Tax=Paenibacillus sp. HWE-109 TaxID=1306526 RepID=UPI001EDCC6C4|nr:histidine kinase [Paenibacillus sp. HWE-109]UKS26888.1 histidine kinase [Paenibacillus sp. HWE-109]
MRRYLNTMSLKSKVTLAFVLLILLPFIVLGLYTYDQTQRYMRDQLIANSQMTLKQVKSTIENKIELIESVSNSITYNYRLQQFLAAPYSQANNSLDDYFSYAVPLINYAMLFQKINTEKISVYMSNETIPEGFGAFYHETKAIQEPWYDTFKHDEKKSLWVIRQSQELGETFGYMQKIISLEDRDLGFSLVDVRPSDLLDPIARIAESNRHIVLMDAQGRIRFPEGSGATDRAPSLKPPPSGSYVIHNNQLFISEPLKGLDLSMLMTITLPRSFGSLQVVTNLAFLTAMVLLLFAFYSVLKFALRKMKTSIGQMAHAIESGFEPIPNDRQDEFGVITEKFNLLLNKITVLMKDRIRQETMHKDAQFIALQSQINPHFIYNTLDMFSAKMELAGQFDVSDAMADFGKMMRYNMDNQFRFTTLEAEIRYLEQYMNLQKIKYGDNIELGIRVPDTLLPFQIIRFILQPIVENSIKHGFPQQETLRIELDISLQPDNTIRLSIHDNGPGIAPRRLLELNERFRTSAYTPSSSPLRESIGLGNINERLKLYYGEDYSIRLDSVPGQYAETILTIPYNAREEDSHV